MRHEGDQHSIPHAPHHALGVDRNEDRGKRGRIMADRSFTHVFRVRRPIVENQMAEEKPEREMNPFNHHD